MEGEFDILWNHPFCIGGNWYNAIKRQQNNEKDKFFRESPGQV